ncbi:MAG: sodium:solute symporter [Gemmatimonadales bacterium]|nr:sodium:solute symporter [Gemmatimonadales bacterium]
MHWLDWLVLAGTLGFIVAHGVWKTRNAATSDSYLRGGHDGRWWAVCLSVMATQASAITFLSTPGQGYANGMGFVQFYFGLPLAMLVVSFVFIPLYYRWQVYTAYEFIGKRFDRRTRLLTAGLFLIQRGLAAGITIYAPGIILSKILNWPLSWTCILTGTLVIIYTTTGGARAVGVTHKQQMAVMFAGLFIAFGLTVRSLGDHASFTESLQLAELLGRLEVIDLSWNPETRYTLWSGLIGGFFLQLAYFGTDQSQVQRYLGGESAGQARQGMLWNGVLKIPMQAFILLTGVLVFVFYLFNRPPVHWNPANVAALAAVTDSSVQTRRDEIAARQAAVSDTVRRQAAAFVAARRANDEAAATRLGPELRATLDREKTVRDEFRTLVAEAVPGAEPVDTDYVFLSYILDHLPVGIIGILLAMIFSAGMSSTSAELSALATTAVVDVWAEKRTDEQQVRVTRFATVGFGLLALGFAALFSLYDNLIQAINEIGSVFYGTLLGVFLVAFFVRWVHGTAVFIAALVAQAAILALFVLEKQGILHIAFLWYNLIAPGILVLLAMLIQAVSGRRNRAAPST